MDILFHGGELSGDSLDLILDGRCHVDDLTTAVMTTIRASVVRAPHFLTIGALDQRILLKQTSPRLVLKHGVALSARKFTVFGLGGRFLSHEKGNVGTDG